MTAKTAASHVRPRICIRKIKSEWGKLADAYYPGDVVYESAAGTWTAVTTGVGQLNRVGVINEKPRIDSNFARKDIDEAFAAGDNVEIIGLGDVVCSITDQNASRLRGVDLTYSATAGALTAAAATEKILATVLDAVADNDTKASVRLVGTGWV